MALDATARETNFRDSMRRYLFSNLKTVEGYSVFFRQGFTSVNIVESKSADKWILISFGAVRLDIMSEAIIEIRPCTRGDTSFFKLAQMVDKIMGYLTPSSGDGTTRIPFYQSAAVADDWTEIGGIVVQDVDVSGDLIAEDNTNYRVITVRVRFASKV
ncbi:MAG: hypothetical protein SVK08_01995 [Halobacteriota archaeon]|nr:hypothetical protein [Halobacteriota archaeon]